MIDNLMLALRQAHYRHEGQGERLFQVASLLLSRGATVISADTGGQLPLRSAMDPVHLPLIELLLEHRAAVPADGLYWAIVESSPVLTTTAQQAWGKKLLPMLMRHGADSSMNVGRELDQTYDQLAKKMRVGDLLDRAKVRHAPR